MKRFYISDPHFFHENIIHLCDRPFKSVEEMNETIVTNWNSVVEKGDLVYILGDFAMRWQDPKQVYDILERLNGQKFLVRGNHDRLHKDAKFRSYFEFIKDYETVNDDGRMVVLFHYPIEDWNGRFRGSYHLFGHIHQNEKNAHPMPRRYNVSVDVNNYTPQTLNQLIEKHSGDKYEGI